MKSNKFHWGKVTLRAGDETPIEGVKALIYGDSGLCITQYNPHERQGKFVSVSHVRSGKRLTNGFYTHQSARWFCEAISGVVNWNEVGPIGEEVNRWPHLWRDVREMRQLVIDHKEQWRKALIIKKLNGGLSDETT